jgi:hypothetical protein
VYKIPSLVIKEHSVKQCKKFWKVGGGLGEGGEPFPKGFRPPPEDPVISIPLMLNWYKRFSYKGIGWVI